MTTPITTPTTTNLTTQKMTVEVSYQAAIDAIEKALAHVDPFYMDNKTISRADLLAVLTRVVTAVKQTKADRLAVASSLAAERAALAEAKPLRAALKSFVQARYGKTTPELQQFGFVQNRTRKVKAESKAASVAKARATRSSLGTKGRQQKANAKAEMKARAAAPAPSAAAEPTPRATVAPKTQS